MPLPVDIRYFGNEDLIGRRNKWAFFCSHTVPDEAFGKISDWVNSLDPEKDCVICGILSGVEKFTLRRLVTRGVPLIVTFAEKLPEKIEDVAKKLIDYQLDTMMGEQKLLLASFAREEDGDAPSGRNAEYRNRWMMNISDGVVVGYTLPKGRLSVQLCGRTDVKYLMEPEAVTYSREECEQRGWSIYYYLRSHLLNMHEEEIKRMLLHYLRMDIERPSKLHSCILFIVTRDHRYLGTRFNFTAFMRMWGMENLQTEDWQRTKGKDGRYYLSVGEKALLLLSKMKEEFRDRELVKALAAQAVKYYPKNSTYQSLL